MDVFDDVMYIKFSLNLEIFRRIVKKVSRALLMTSVSRNIMRVMIIMVSLGFVCL